MHGRIKFYKTDKRYGFIIAEDGKEYIVHEKSVLIVYDKSKFGKNLLERGEFVEFEVGKCPKGNVVAVNVKPISRSKELDA